MNKNLIAIAITAALAVPSMAAAEIKIIGQAQLELVNTSGDAVTEGLTLGDSSKVGTINKNNASALGVTGSHDLGNGLNGLYKINFNFHADDDTAFSARDQFVGLKGGFGTVLVGRINTPYKTATVKWDPFLATFMQARSQNGMSILHNGYASNVIAYANNFGSAKFVGAIALDESNKDTPVDNEYDGEHAVTASLNMPIADSMELAVAFLSGQTSHLQFPGSDVADKENGTAVKVGLKFKSGDLTVAGQIESIDDKLTDETIIYVTASMALGDGASISAGFGASTDDSDAENDGTYTAIGYKKALSKKVSYHAGIVIIDEGVATADNDVTQIGAGLRIKF